MDQRIKGQETSIKVIQAGIVIETIETIAVFNDSTNFETKEAGYLGETANRYDEVYNGVSGDFEFNVSRPGWNDFVKAIEDRATRKTPDVVFNIVRADLYPNGDSSIVTYEDVAWGPVPTNIPSRGDYIKVRMEFKCARKTVKNNALL